MDVLRFVLIGLGAGGLYALIAQGMVLVYRGSGILNFAQGGFVMVGAYGYYQATVEWGLPLWLGLLFAVFSGAVAGAFVQLLVLRHMQQASALLRVIATLAVLMVLQSGAVLLYGSDLKSAPSFLPTGSVGLFSDVAIGSDRLILFVLGIGSTVVLWSVYRYTSFGRATSAVAENERVAASLGHSPERIALSNWVLGASISALAGALIAPITYLQPTLLVMLVIPALAVGLLANFASFPIVFLAAAGLGIAEALTARYVTAPGWSQSIAFLIVIAVMVMRGRGIPLRSHVLDRLASVGSGRVRPIPITVLFVILCVLYSTVLPTPWLNAFTVTVGFSLLCLSIVLVTGYAGQLSLAQYVLAGAGGLVAARLMSDLQWPFLLAVLGSVVITAGIGLIVALPALRTRGINLAVVTLGLGVVVFNVVLNNTDISGGTSGIPIPKLSVFGFNLSGILYPERYVTAATVLLFVVGIALLNLRRGAAGRRLLAVRSNERASAAMGVSVVGSKLYAFSTGAAIAALAGVVLTFRSASVVTIHFDPFSSITAVAMTVIGGVGYVGGGVLGGTLMPSGVGSELFSGIDGIDTWLPLISGLMLLFILVREPSGLWQMNAQMAQSLIERVRKPFAARSRKVSDERLQKAADADNADVAVERVPAQALTVDGVRVSFGAVVAVANATLTVEPGQVHGLIGPNGAGKTTVIDALTGFVRAESGTVRIGDIDLTKLSPQRRVKAGLGRSFQSLELLEDLTIRENLAIASERWRNSKYFTDLVAPGRIELTGTALAAAREFGLMNKLDLKPGALSMGQRRLAAIARAAASSPSILCLDEPAAGLSDPEAQHLALLLRRLANEWGMGILLVEHNIDMVLAACDKITVLTAGSVLVSGDPQAVRHDPRVLSAYLGEEQSEDSADLTASVN